MITLEPDRSHAEGGPRCSTGSSLKGESLAATASLGRRWLLVEIAGAWGWSAFLGSPAIDRSLGRRIVARAEAEGMRIAALRRPGRDRGEGRWRWMIVDTEPGSESIRRGECSSPEQLLELPLDGSSGARDDTPVFAVCANGRHDECCAVRGRRVAADLAEWYPEETWECSHIGGDRFAATMLLFPHGLNYGRVDHHDAPAIAARYLEGRVALEGFRGRTSHDRIVQAADWAARTQLGDDRLDALRPAGVREHSAGWTVELVDETRTARVEVVGTTGPDLYTTCRATEAVPVAHFVATGVQTASPPTR